jgi:toxin ParE1/3/4
MKRFVLTPAAEADLIDILDFISADNPVAARRVLVDLRNSMRQLARMPKMGHLRDDLAGEPLRLWPLRSYIVVYRPDTAELQVPPAC